MTVLGIIGIVIGVIVVGAIGLAILGGLAAIILSAWSH